MESADGSRSIADDVLTDWLREARQRRLDGDDSDGVMRFQKTERELRDSTVMASIEDGTLRRDPTPFQKTERILQDSSVIASNEGGMPRRDPTPPQVDASRGDGENKTLVTSTDSQIIFETLRLYGSMYLVFFVVFCIVRRKFFKTYHLRTWVPKLKTDLAVRLSEEYKDSWISWSWRVFKVDDDQLLEHCGLDALCFLRCLRLGAKLTFQGALHSIWLIPLYLTAEESAETSYLTDRFVILTLANLPSNSPRQIAPVVAAYIIVFYSLYLVSIEFEWYITYRHKFLIQRIPRNYAVYVSGIPSKYRSSFALKEYFSTWNSSVAEAHLAMDIPKLEAKVERREKVIADLERVFYMERTKPGVKQQHRALFTGGSVASSRNGARGTSNRSLSSSGSHAAGDSEDDGSIGRTSPKRKSAVRRRIGRISNAVSDRIQLTPSEEAYTEELQILNRDISLAIGKILNSNDRRRHKFRRSAAVSSISDFSDSESTTASDSGLRRRKRPRTLKALSGRKEHFSGRILPDDLGRNKKKKSFADPGSLEIDELNMNSKAASRRYRSAGKKTFKSPKDTSTNTLKTSGTSCSSFGGLEPIIESCSPDRPLQIYRSKSEDSVESLGVPDLNAVDDKPQEHETKVPAIDPNWFAGADQVDHGDIPEISEPPPFVHQNPVMDLFGLGPLFENTPSLFAHTSHEPKPMDFNERIEQMERGEEVDDEDEQIILFEPAHDSEQRINDRESVSAESEPVTDNDEISREPSSSAISAGGSIDDEQKRRHPDGQLSSDSQEPSSSTISAGSSIDDERTRRHPDGLSSDSREPSSSSTISADNSIGKERTSRHPNRRLHSAALATMVSHRFSSGRKMMKSNSEQMADGLKNAGKISLKGVIRAKQTLQSAPDLGASIVGSGASTIAETAATIAPILRKSEDGTPRDAGFVTFRDLYTTHAARQMVHHPTWSKMAVEPAPKPEEIIWRYVGMPAEAKRAGWVLSMAATTALCFFWSIPSAFLSSLTEVNSLRETFPALDDVLKTSPWLEQFLALVAPLLLLLLNEAFLPSLLTWISMWEGFIGAPTLEASVFVKLSAFVIVQTFFVSAVSGSITAEISNILDNPGQLVTLLSNSLPAQSSYFLQIIFVFTFLLQGLELLRAYPLALAFLRRFVGPRATPKERRKSWGLISSLEDPPAFFHAETFAQMVLFYVIFFVYATIAPITCVFIMISFLICESGFRYHFIFNVSKDPDSGGKIWKGFMYVLLGSMVIGVVTLMGFLALKQAIYAVPSLLPLIGLIVLYMLTVLPHRIRVADNLPTTICAEVDRQRVAEPKHMEFAARKYLQPALRHPRLFPDNPDDNEIEAKPAPTGFWSKLLPESVLPFSHA